MPWLCLVPFELCSVQAHRKHIVLVSKSLPHECSNSPPWIFYNQFVPWCFLKHKVKFFLFNLPPKEHGMYWNRITSVTSCWNDCVVSCKQNPPGIVPNPHKLLYCVPALGPHISRFTIPSCFKGIVSDRTMLLISPSLILAEGCRHYTDTLFRKTRISPARLTSSRSAQINISLQTRLQGFLIFIIHMRDTFPVWKLEYTRHPVDPGPDVTHPLSLLSSATLSSQTNRVCHSRQIFICQASFPYASSCECVKNTVTAILKPKIPTSIN